MERSAGAQGASPAAHEALEKLCRVYWRPIYSFMQRQGVAPEEAEDITQGFFASLFERGSLSAATSSWLEDKIAAEQLYMQATAVDPGFALAYARASLLNSAIPSMMPPGRGAHKMKACA